VPFIIYVDDYKMTGASVSSRALALTLQDATALAAIRGPGSKIALGAASGITQGAASGDTDILAPSGFMLSGDEAEAALKSGASRYFFSCGNQSTAPDVSSLAPLLDLLIERSGIGFMAACFAAPAQGRTVYQGHLFQDGRLVANLHRAWSEQLSGRVSIIPHDIIAAGTTAIQRRITACREQGIALALLDAVDHAQCDAIATTLETALLTAGPAWLAGASQKPEPAAPVGRLAIISGALDRQTLFQLGSARAIIPFLQLDVATPGTAAAALAWAAGQDAPKFIISASAPPDRLHTQAPVVEILADIAAGLADAGIRRFVITGNDTACTILSRLGVRTLTAGAFVAGLRWLSGAGYNFLLKPAGFGGHDLLLGGIEPQIRLNAAAE
jgi:3-dehydrotetronate 4-kinase